MSQERHHHSKLLDQGRELTPKAAKELEAKVKSNPDDFESRIPLISYYMFKRPRTPDEDHSYQEAVLWLIEKYPSSPVTGSPEATHVGYVGGPDLHVKAKQLWLKNIADQNENANVLRNAAMFFMRSEKLTAEELFQKARALEPDNSKWPKQLGLFYQREAHGKQEEERQTLAAKSLVQFERVLEQSEEPVHKYFLLDDLAKVAYEAGELKKAEQYANQLLKLGEEPDISWRNGNAVHHGNLVLGRLALKAGDLEKAKKHLLEAGKTKGSPQLNSFGPNMLLAKELLEKGEREIVLEYFQLCGKFWKRPQLEQWTATVKGGGIPDFRANLRY